MNDAAVTAQDLFAALKKTAHPIDGKGLDLLFRQARTVNGWLDKPVGDDLLRQLFELMKMAPTAFNCSPVRILFLRSVAAKERLRPALSPANVDKTMAAPATAIIGFDLTFFDHLPRLFPRRDVRPMYADKPEAARVAATRNGSLQGGYFILAARALGLDCGPMSGFDNAKVDAEFFAGTATVSNFLCNVGYGDPASVSPRSPRLEFAEACQIL
ncbi:MAG: malonic semialdehyde reductase [Alphaproteobacteria bacterium]|nr:malonic semialdehyde reductase [Alphaproteobacteria bacterium]